MTPEDRVVYAAKRILRGLTRGQVSRLENLGPAGTTHISVVDLRALRDAVAALDSSQETR